MPRINIESPVYDNYDEAFAYGDVILKNYHPMGYGTSIGIHINGNTKEDSTEFQVKGYRYDSCD